MIAEMRIMRPDNDLAVAAVKMTDERSQRLGHMFIAQVPRLLTPTEHGAIIILCICDQARVLLRIKEFVLGNLTRAAH